MSDQSRVIRQHGYHAVRVGEVVEETADTKSFVLEVPAELRDLFSYQAVKMRHRR